MSDALLPEQRSWNMGRVRSANTKPEIAVRSVLHRLGFRFRVNRRDLPGTPDIVLPKYRTVVFVHGCFWHRHKGCRRCTTPATRRGYWQEKFAQNVRRDEQATGELNEKGWRVIVVWECEIRTDPVEVAMHIVDAISGAGNRAVYSLPSGKEILKVAEERMLAGLRRRT